MMLKNLMGWILICVFGCTLQAGVVPGRWEKVEGLEKNTPLRVTLNSGEPVEALFQELGPQELVVLDSSGTTLRWPRSLIHKIETEEKVAGNGWKGLGIGAAVGAGVGFGLGALNEIGRNEGNPFLDLPYPAFGLVFTGIGAVSGWALDRATGSRTLLYASP